MKRDFFCGLSCVLVLCAGSLGARASDESDGGKLFLKLCAPCHGPDGRARTRAARKLGVKDLTKSETSDAEIRKQIIEGRKDKNGAQKMPAFGDRVTAEQIEALLAEVKKFRK